MTFVLLKNYDHYVIVNDDADVIAGRGCKLATMTPSPHCCAAQSVARPLQPFSAIPTLTGADSGYAQRYRTR
jgi:hypothetical protein